jgi:alkylhydroperoxidase family enzyme
MKQTAIIIPGAMEALQSLAKAAEQSGVPKKTLDLVHLRASQIKGCSVCVDMGLRFKKGRGRDKRTPVRLLGLRLGRGDSTQSKRTSQVTTALKYYSVMISFS